MLLRDCPALVLKPLPPPQQYPRIFSHLCYTKHPSPTPMNVTGLQWLSQHKIEKRDNIPIL